MSSIASYQLGSADENMKYFSPFCYDHESINSELVPNMADKSKKDKESEKQMEKDKGSARPKIFNRKNSADLDSFFNYC